MQRTVVVGMGHIGHRHARAYTECEQAQLVAVCDRVEELARAAGEKFGVPYFTSAKECYAAMQPDIVSILIGINDVGVSRNTGISLKARQFPEQFEYLIQGILENTGARILCLGPFLFPHPEEYLNWIPETLRAEHWISEISANYQLPFCPLQETLNQEAKRQGYDALTTDGIHPTAAGNQIICAQWLSLYHRYCGK